MNFNQVPKPHNDAEPDITEKDLHEIKRRLLESGARKLEDLTGAELKTYGIKKKIGPKGEVIFDLGYSPDTGKRTKQMNIRVETAKKILTPEDEKRVEAAQKAIHEAFEKARQEGNPYRLPSSEDEL